MPRTALLMTLCLGRRGIKTVRSHLSTRDVAALAAAGGRAAGPAPLPPAEPGAAVEVDRVVPPLPVRVACAARTALAPSLTRTNAYFHVLGRTGPADPAKTHVSGPFFLGRVEWR